MGDKALLTLTQLQGVCMTAEGRRACSQYLAPLVTAMQRYQINTRARIAAFLAQVAH